MPRNNHGFTVQVFWDSDVGKWIEAAAYALAHRRDPDIEAKIDAIVDDLAKAQSPDGYLNCWYNGREPDKRWTNLRDNHELYNAGHLLEGAIAYFRITGRRRFLDIMERYVDHIAATFGTGPGQKRGYPGHQEIELALYKLYRLTGDKRRLDLARYFIDERGHEPPHYFTEEAIARGDDPGQILARNLRIQSVAPSGARTDQGRRPCGQGDVHAERDGRSRRRARRRRPQARVRNAVARRDDGANVRHRRLGPEGNQRGLHRAVSICRTRPLTRRPAPRSPSSSGPSACCISISTAATRT